MWLVHVVHPNDLITWLDSLFCWLVQSVSDSVVDACGWFMWLLKLTGSCDGWMWMIQVDQHFWFNCLDPLFVSVVGPYGWLMWLVHVVGSCSLSKWCNIWLVRFSVQLDGSHGWLNWLVHVVTLMGEYGWITWLNYFGSNGCFKGSVYVVGCMVGLWLVQLVGLIGWFTWLV